MFKKFTACALLGTLGIAALCFGEKTTLPLLVIRRAELHSREEGRMSGALSQRPPTPTLDDAEGLIIHRPPTPTLDRDDTPPSPTLREAMYKHSVRLEERE